MGAEVPDEFVFLTPDDDDGAPAILPTKLKRPVDESRPWATGERVRKKLLRWRRAHPLAETRGRD